MSPGHDSAEGAVATVDSAYPQTTSPPSRVATELVCLMGIAVLIATFGLRNGPKLGDHEAIVGQAARSIRESGHWLVPTVNGDPRIRKPPLAAWTAAAASFFTDTPTITAPVSEAAARLPSAVAAILTVVIVYLIGRAMFGHSIAAIAGSVTACCCGTFYFAHNAQVEMQLTCLTTAAYACFWFATESTHKPRFFAIAFYIALAGTMLAKAPLPLAFVVLPLAIWWFVTVPSFRLVDTDPALQEHSANSRLTIFANQWGRLRSMSPVLGCIVFLILFLPWPVYVALKYPSSIELWRIEYLARYTGDLSDVERPAWYYIPIALGLMLPFSLSLPEAIISPFLGIYQNHRRPLLFLLTLIAVPFLFLSSAAFKRPHYLVGCIPAMSLLLGPTLHRFFFRERRFVQRSNLAIAAVAGTLLLVAIVAGSRALVSEFHADAKLLAPAGALLVVGIVASVALFLLRRAPAILVCLVLTMAATYSLAWDGFGSIAAMDGRVPEMAAQLHAHNITRDDRIVWLTGRPDARLGYYHNFHVERLLSAIELAPVREGRGAASATLIEHFVDEVKNTLSNDPATYFVVQGRFWDSIMSVRSLEFRRVFRVGSDADQTGRDDWVVFTGTQDHESNTR